MEGPDQAARHSCDPEHRIRQLVPECDHDKRRVVISRPMRSGPHRRLHQLFPLCSCTVRSLLHSAMRTAQALFLLFATVAAASPVVRTNIEFLTLDNPVLTTSSYLSQAVAAGADSSNVARADIDSVSDISSVRVCFRLIKTIALGTRLAS